MPRLRTNDIGTLFATLQAAYGYRWAHKADAVPVWLAKLKPYTTDQVMDACSRAIDIYPDPPTLSQFLAVLKAAKPRNTTYVLPAPFDRANADQAWDHMEKLAGRSLRPGKGD